MKTIKITQKINISTAKILAENPKKHAQIVVNAEFTTDCQELIDLFVDNKPIFDIRMADVYYDTYLNSSRVGGDWNDALRDSIITARLIPTVEVI